MKKITRKIISTILAVAVLLSTAVAGMPGMLTAFAEDNIQWSFADGVLTITGSGDMPDYSSGGEPWHEVSGSVTSVEIGYGITRIGNNAFYQYGNLSSVIVPGSVSKIGKNAFRYCSKLNSVTLNDGLTEIEDGAFCWCTGLTSISIPGSVNKIDQFAFDDCHKLATIELHEGLTEIETYALSYCSVLSNLILPSTIETLGDNVFYSTYGTITFKGTENDWKKVSGYSQCGSSNIVYFYREEGTCGDDITWKYGIDKVLVISGSGEMYDLDFPLPWEEEEISSEVETVIIDENITSIGNNAFCDFINLKSITIPKNITYIGEYAFINCGSLTELIIPSTVECLGEHAFENVACTITYDGTEDEWELIVGYEECSAANVAFTILEKGTCGDNITWKVTADYTFVVSGSGEMYNYNNNNDRPYRKYAFSVKKIQVTGDITTLGNHAFESFTSCTCYDIQSPITSIGQSAFGSNHGLTEFTVPETVNTIGSGAFGNCGNLVSFTFSENITAIPDSCFQWCDSLTTVNTPGGITSIGSNAFYNCSALTGLTLSTDLISVGANAFYGVTKTITYDGAESEWQTVTGYADCGSTNIVFTLIARGTCGDNITWKVTPDYTFVVSGSGEMYNYDNNINRPYHSYASSVKKIQVTGDITSLGKRAFDSFTSCTCYDIQSPITSIGQWAFGTNPGLTEYTVPETVTTIGPGAFGTCRNLVTFTFPENITAIPEDCFEWCNSLTTVNTPGGITSIGEDAFRNCSSLTGLTLSTDLISVGANAFYGVTKTITYDGAENEWQTVTGYAGCGSTNIAFTLIARGTCGDNIMWKVTPDYTFVVSGSGEMYNYDNNTDRPYNSYADSVTKIQVTGEITSFGKRAFDSFTSCTCYDIQSPIISIGQSSFGANPGLTEFTVPETVNTIGSGAFGNCGNLVSFTFSENITIIPENCFVNDTSLTTVNLPSGILSIGANAFNGCSSLTEFTIPKCVTSVGDNAFNGVTSTITYPGAESEWQAVTGYEGCGSTNIQFVNRSGVFGDSGMWYLETATKTLTVSCVGDMPNFTENETPWQAEKGNFTKVIFSEGVTSIGNNAFCGFSNVTSYTLPDSLISIGANSFKSNGGLTSITFPENLLTIGNSAFRGCRLQSVSIPDSVTCIDNGAFSCNEWTLTSAKLPKSMKTIKSGVFQECYNLRNVVLPENLETIEANAFLFCHFNSITFPETLKTIGGSAFRQSQFVNLVLPDNLTSLSGSAFAQNDYLKSVKLPKNLTHIANEVFSDCDNLDTIIWPDKLVSIDRYAFNKTGFTSITIPETVTNIGYNCFSACTKLESVVLPSGLTTIQANTFNGDTALTTVNIPSSVKTISNTAFNNCTSLTGLSLPGTLTTVGENAFNGVTSTIVFDGTDAEWNNVTGSDICGSTNFSFNYSVVSFNANEHGTAPDAQKILNGETAEQPEMSNVTGYLFGYWYINGSEDTAFDFTTPITANTTLYAKWNTCSHSWSGWTIIRNSTATQTGLMKRTCSICGEVEERTIPVLIPDYPTSITLNKTSLVLSHVDIEELTATVNPSTAKNKNVVWSSSNTRVAKVVNGVVVALSPGYTVITVSTTDDRYPICEATCTVHVTAISTLSTDTLIDNELNLISGISPKLDNLNEHISVIDGCSLEYSTPVIGTGTKVDIIQNGETVDSYTALVYGDTNGDGVYDGTDAMIVNCIVKGILTREQVGEAVWSAADCNHDGVIDELDVALLNEAGLLLSQVNQTNNEEELKTDLVYQEYLSLIDQSPAAEEGDGQTAEPEATTTEKSTILDLIRLIVEAIFNYMKTLFTFVK